MPGIGENEIWNLNPYKNHELGVLSTFIVPDTNICAPGIIVEGPESSGKTFTVIKYANYLRKKFDVKWMQIKCDYCMTRRRVLRKVLEFMEEILEVDPDYTEYRRRIHSSRQMSHCENLSNFTYVLKHTFGSALENKVKEVRSQTVLFVLDRVDRMLISEQIGELCGALTRLHEQDDLFQGICFVFVVNRADYLNLSTMSIPTIQFTSYNIEQINNIIGKKFVSDEWLEAVYRDLDSAKISKKQLQIFIRSFVEYIVKTYGSYFGHNMDMIIPALRRLWPAFYEPIKARGSIKPRVNDVLTTFMRKRRLLQTEYGLVTKIADENGIKVGDMFISRELQSPTKANENKKTRYDLPLRTKYIVVASFLASFTDPKYDMVNFSKNRELRSNRRVRYKRRKTNTSNETMGTKLMSPKPFSLERMLAILRSVATEFDVGQELADDVQLQNDISTLTSLKMLIKMGAHDTIGGATKWRTNMEWSAVQQIANDVGFKIENYLQY